MPNALVEERLAGIRDILLGVHRGSKKLSSTSKGRERQRFIDGYLSKVLPPVYGFGSGDATDAYGNHSGELDVVVEYPFAPALPSVNKDDKDKLYLAESIAAVIEVKSDLSGQWGEAMRTLKALATVRRQMGPTMQTGYFPKPTIPFFVVGYRGWKKMETLKEKVQKNPGVTGILVIDSGLFTSSPDVGAADIVGVWALWGLICSLHTITNGLRAAGPEPWAYFAGVKPFPPPRAT